MNWNKDFQFWRRTFISIVLHVYVALIYTFSHNLTDFSNLEFTCNVAYVHDHDIWPLTSISKFKELWSTPANKFNLQVGKRQRLPHGTSRKDLTQGSCMPKINALSSILQKIWSRSFWQTDRQPNWRTNEF